MFLNTHPEQEQAGPKIARKNEDTLSSHVKRANTIQLKTCYTLQKADPCYRQQQKTFKCSRGLKDLL